MRLLILKWLECVSLAVTLAYDLLTCINCPTVLMFVYTTGENDATEVVAARVLGEFYAYSSRVSSDLTSVVKAPQGGLEVDSMS